jgi:hypothetical protein
MRHGNAGFIEEQISQGSMLWQENTQLSVQGQQRGKTASEALSAIRSGLIVLHQRLFRQRNCQSGKRCGRFDQVR